MSDTLYVAMSGAKQLWIAQAINSNNLANVTTPGFRADLYNAQSYNDPNTADSSNVYVQTEKPVTDFTPGAIMTTERDLDIAIEGKGWIAVQKPDGSEAYTRAGNLQVNTNGQLVTSRGDMVLGNGGPIAIPPAEKLSIGIDGTINIRPIGQSAKALATIDRIKLVNPNESELTKGEDGLFHVTSNEAQSADAGVKVISRSLESSNVNPVDSMVNIIALAREFEIQLKMMQQTEDSGDVLAQLLQQ